MCGVFGLIAKPTSGIKVSALEKAACMLFKLSQTRGKDACGALAVLDDRIEIVKSRERVGKLLKRVEFTQLLASAVQGYQAGKPFVVAGHTRMATNGTQENTANNQPVSKEPLLLLHNGIIVNDTRLWRTYPHLERKHQVDTEIAAAIMQDFVKQGGSLAAAMSQVFDLIEGANTIVAVSCEADELIAGTSNGSLYLAEVRNCGIVVFASELQIVERAATLLSPEQKQNMIEQVLPGRSVIIDFSTATARHLSINEAASVSPSVAPKLTRSISETSLTDLRAHHAISGTTSILDIERQMGTNWRAIHGIQRCTRCILPATFPSIRFNGEGVCNFCCAHIPKTHKGEAALHELADLARNRNGGRDCLVPISGGRDSCYGLHYVKTELRLNPVAYTYDWGFVTDLARRNISRMCGRLGVEHILVAADIRAKRENVRKNVAAWLRKPELGMIPLFMAGDKMFFYYASAISRQMSRAPILFSMNWLERTGFKSAFAGTDDSGYPDDASGKTYGLGLGQQARMLAYFARNIIINPAYVNTSISDTLFGFYSYYIRGKDYESIFDYLAWDEQSIVSSIVQQYDWETSPDTDSTWRIGDGTAPFYNYIYFTTCGFSEHDTFRSNQIREGLVKREDAMALIDSENSSRPVSFKWYCDTIGIDPIEALKIINGMPKRYEL
jgi:glutamine---fructose-6-phosphate transaminase (isomerizing)